MDSRFDAAFHQLFSQLSTIFSGYDIRRTPTQHLFSKRLAYDTITSNAASVIYKLAAVEGGFLCFETHHNSLSIVFLRPTGIELNNNNVGLTWHPPRGTYILGVRMNCPGVRMRGETAVRAILKIARIMMIKQIFILDVASVGFRHDPTKIIEHISILRLIGGKKGYYERFGARYIRSGAVPYLLSQLTETDIATCKNYLEGFCEPDLYNKLVTIVRRSIAILTAKGYLPHVQELLIITDELELGTVTEPAT